MDKSVKERFEAKGQDIKAWTRKNNLRYGLVLDILNDNLDIGKKGSATLAVATHISAYLGDNDVAKTFGL